TPGRPGVDFSKLTSLGHPGQQSRRTISARAAARAKQTGRAELKQGMTHLVTQFISSTRWGGKQGTAGRAFPAEWARLDSNQAPRDYASPGGRALAVADERLTTRPPGALHAPCRRSPGFALRRPPRRAPLPVRVPAPAVRLREGAAAGPGPRPRRRRPGACS